MLNEDESGSGKADSFKIKNLKMNKTYANLGYGLADNLEAFVRLGGADAKYKDEYGDTYKGDTGFAYGFGTKATLYEEGDLKLGGYAQKGL